MIARISHIRSMLRKLLLSTIGLCSAFVLKAQTTYTHTLSTMWGYSLTSNTAFTFPAAPNTMGGATLTFSWLACYQGGFGTTGIRVRLRTGASTYVDVHNESGGTISCAFQARTATIAAALLQQALAYGAGTVQGDVRIDDACQPGVGCSFYNDPGLQNMTLSYEVSAANFTSPDAGICPGGVVQFNDASINSPTSHLWSFPGGTPSTSTLPSPAVQYTTPGQYDVTLAVVTADGESSITRTGFVTVHPLPAANAGADQNICEGASVVVQASGGSSYVWSPSTGLSSTTEAGPTASPESTTTYTVLVTSAQGCEAADQVVVNVVPAPVPQIEAPEVLCLGDTLELNATGATFYTWSPNLFISSTAGSAVQVWPTADQSWSVTGTDAFGCIGSATVALTVVPPPAAPLVTWADMMLTSTEAVAYQWYVDGTLLPGANAQHLEPEVNGAYTVEITDESGCTAWSEAYPFNSVGVAERSSSVVRTYPIPTRELLFVEGAAAGIAYRLVDVQGRVIVAGRIADAKHNISMSGIAPGVYNLQLGADQDRSQLTVVVE